MLGKKGVLGGVGGGCFEEVGERKGRSLRGVFR